MEKKTYLFTFTDCLLSNLAPQIHHQFKKTPLPYIILCNLRLYYKKKFLTLFISYIELDILLLIGESIKKLNLFEDLNVRAKDLHGLTTSFCRWSQRHQRAIKIIRDIPGGDRGSRELFFKLS